MEETKDSENGLTDKKNQQKIKYLKRMLLGSGENIRW